MGEIDWIAVEWSLSHLRLWAMDAAGGVQLQRQSDDGAEGLDPDQFEPALTALLPEVPDGARVPVVCCGAVGGRRGWAEAPCLAVPCSPPAIDSARSFQLGAFDIHILPGIKQSSPPDMIRGDETRVAGFLDTEPKFDGVLCLTGPQSRWVHVSAGEIVSFRSFMTGEMFDLLRLQSSLRNVVAAGGWDQPAFDAAVDDCLSRPAELAARLASLGAAVETEGLSPSAARARLSGLLIGAELSAARPYWLGQQVVVLGDDEAARGYEAALTAQGCFVRRSDGQDATLAGLRVAYRQLTGQGAQPLDG